MAGPQNDEEVRFPRFTELSVGMGIGRSPEAQIDVRRDEPSEPLPFYRTSQTCATSAEVTV